MGNNKTETKPILKGIASGTGIKLLDGTEDTVLTTIAFKAGTSQETINLINGHVASIMNLEIQAKRSYCDMLPHLAILIHGELENSLDGFKSWNQFLINTLGCSKGQASGMVSVVNRFFTMEGTLREDLDQRLLKCDYTALERIVKYSDDEITEGLTKLEEANKLLTDSGQKEMAFNRANIVDSIIACKQAKLLAIAKEKENIDTIDATDYTVYDIDGKTVENNTFNPESPEIANTPIDNSNAVNAQNKVLSFNSSELIPLIESIHNHVDKSNIKDKDKKVILPLIDKILKIANEQ